jgi:hypothetical protein
MMNLREAGLDTFDAVHEVGELPKAVAFFAIYL